MKKLKKILAVLLALICITSVTPCTAYAANQFSEYVSFSFFDGSDFDSKDSAIPGSFTSSFIQATIEEIDLDISVPVQIDKGSKVTVTLNSWQGGRYVKWDSMYLVDYDTSDSRYLYDDVSVSYGGSSSGIYTITFTAHQTIKSNENITLILYKPHYSSSWASQATTSKSYFKVTSVEWEITDKSSAEQSSFFDKVGDWFNNLFQWLKDIRDNAVNGFANIGTWFSQLGNNIKTWFSDLSDNISDFFSNLISNIKTQFTNITNNLRDWFSNIGQWFSDIGDRISDFFEKLWNRIYWGNENGESEYQKPVIDNKLNDILDKLQEYQENLKSAILTIDSAAEDVSAYISTGTQLVNGVINVAGVGFTALIVFGIVFILVRKVVGR